MRHRVAIRLYEALRVAAKCGSPPARSPARSSGVASSRQAVASPEPPAWVCIRRPAGIEKRERGRPRSRRPRLSRSLRRCTPGDRPERQEGIARTRVDPVGREAVGVESVRILLLRVSMQGENWNVDAVRAPIRTPPSTIGSFGGVRCLARPGRGAWLRK